MKKFFRRLLPNHDAVNGNRWLKPFANTLLHPRLWHLNRHSAAGGIAAGLFCGLIPGPLQMLGAAICSIIFRVNLPLALATTLYTNPFTIIPLYMVAVAIGQFVLGGDHFAFILAPEYDIRDPIGSLRLLTEWTIQLGKPLAIGLLILASSLAALGYCSVRIFWRWYLLRAWKQRKARRAIGKISG